MKTVTIEQLYYQMFSHMGPQGWWPGETKFEIALGAVLVQNTNWHNVEYSLANLRQETHLEPQKIVQLSNETLQTLIRPSGFYTNKARCISALFAWFQTANFQLANLSKQTTAQLRSQLITLPGIGDETADSILLYCLDKPVFVADSYTRRLFTKLGRPNLTYLKLKRLAEEQLTLNLEQMQEFHGLLDNFGKQELKTFETSFLADFQLEN
ncbi:deoxyribonuclease I [Paucilactobacillus sp. N302-9]